MAIKNELNDPHNVLENWDINSADPCGWRMVTCSSDGYVSLLWITITKNLRNGGHKSFDTSFSVNCGGTEQTSASGIDFYDDSEILGPSSLYTDSQHQWVVNNTGFYISNPNCPQYIATTDSQILESSSGGSPSNNYKRRTREVISIAIGCVGGLLIFASIFYLWWMKDAPGHMRVRTDSPRKG